MICYNVSELDLRYCGVIGSIVYPTGTGSIPVSSVFLTL